MHMAEENDMPESQVPPVEETAGETQSPAEQEQDTPDYAAMYASSREEYLRLYAEFDNYRKRSEKKMIEMRQSAAENVMVEMLPIADDFDRAMQAASTSEDPQAFLEGVTLIYQKFQRVLNARGLTEMNVMNEPFDPDRHNAITNIPAPAPELKGIILDVTEKGYMLNDKIIRHPKVVVGS